MRRTAQESVPKRATYFSKERRNILLFFPCN